MKKKQKTFKPLTLIVWAVLSPIFGVVFGNGLYRINLAITKSISPCESYHIGYKLSRLVEHCDTAEMLATVATVLTIGIILAVLLGYAIEEL